MRDDAGEFVGFRGVGSDVTQQRESDEKIAYLARYDTLTGLPNRLMVTESLREALKYAEQWRTRCAFLMIDLDRFKAVNDSLGHQIGDQMLAQVSQRLKTLASDNEMCGRLGGDEFAVVIRDASDRNAVASFARRDDRRLSQPYDVENHKLYIGASVGSAMGPRDGTTVEALMRNADLALYRAKDEGGCRALRVRAHAARRGRRAPPARNPRCASHRQGRAAAQLPAGGRLPTPRPSSRSRRWCAGRAPSTASSARASSSRWPRTPG